jgi:hypothetical protein
MVIKVETKHTLLPSMECPSFKLIVDPGDQTVHVAVGEDHECGWWMTPEEIRALRNALSAALRLL